MIRKISNYKVWIIVFITFVFLVFSLYILRNPFYDEYTIEAGTKLDIHDLLKEETKNPDFIDVPNDSMLTTVGTYNVKVKNEYNHFTIKLNVKDTTPPTATVKKKTMWIGDEITADIFVSDIKDYSAVTISFLKEPNFSKAGTQDVDILLKDSSGNTTQYKTQLTLKKDTEAPVISTVNTILSNTGETILYKKNTTVTDNRDQEVSLNVDSSKVNYNKPGTYYVLYSATDQAGNTTQKKVKVIILNSKDASYKKEAEKLADKFINTVAKNKKTKEKKLKACFDYIRINMVYNGIHKGSIDNYYIDAVDGLKTWRGDCLVSNGVLRVVCERLEIPTITVTRSSQKKINHYWFMANTGDGWYHYDAFKRTNIIVYKMSSKDLLAWSKSHDNVMTFDYTKYPSSPGE